MLSVRKNTGRNFKLKSKSLVFIIYVLINRGLVFLYAAMATTLSLQSLLDNDKLMGPNFNSWYRKLKIILEHERILYVVTDPVPEEPAPNARGVA